MGLFFTKLQKMQFGYNLCKRNRFSQAKWLFYHIKLSFLLTFRTNLENFVELFPKNVTIGGKNIFRHVCPNLGKMRIISQNRLCYLSISIPNLSGPWNMREDFVNYAKHDCKGISLLWNFNTDTGCTSHLSTQYFELHVFFYKQYPL